MERLIQTRGGVESDPQVSLHADQLVDLVPLTDVANERLDVRSPIKFDSVQADLGVEGRVVVSAVRPLKDLRGAFQCRTYLLARLVLGGAAIGLLGGREAIRRLPDDLVTRAPEHLERLRIAVDEHLSEQQEDSVVCLGKERAVSLFALVSCQFNLSLTGDVPDCPVDVNQRSFIISHDRSGVVLDPTPRAILRDYSVLNRLLLAVPEGPEMLLSDSKIVWIDQCLPAAARPHVGCRESCDMRDGLAHPLERDLIILDSQRVRVVGCER